MLRTDRFTAVSLLDSALNRRILLPADLPSVHERIVGRAGSAKAQRWLTEADPRAESPLETRVRLRATDGGVAPDDLQFRVRDSDDRVVAIADFAWTGFRVVGEADGAEVHDTPAAVFRDRWRQNDIVRAGYIPLRFTWGDTVTPHYVPRTIRTAISHGYAA
jgi:very-short-patch-repair endonuclease